MSVEISLKVHKVIDSCTTLNQWVVADNFYKRALKITNGLHRRNLLEVAGQHSDDKFNELLARRLKPDPLRYCR